MLTGFDEYPASYVVHNIVVRLLVKPREEAVECHGMLWGLDHMEAAAVTEIASLHDGLSQLAAHLRCRLSKKEIRIWLDRYQSLIQRNYSR